MKLTEGWETEATEQESRKTKEVTLATVGSGTVLLSSIRPSKNKQISFYLWKKIFVVFI